MNKKPIEIDESSRKLIVNNIDENYFVEAGAGSGKTSVLVDRMIKMVEEGRDISHICAITFTKAAAKEFYERFQKKLSEKVVENNSYKQRYLDALQNIDLAFMGTIDSFCNMVMSEHPNEGLIPSDAKVIDEDKAEELYKREYSNICNNLYEDESLEAKAKSFLKYHYKPENAFVKTLQILVNKRDCLVVVPSYKEVNIDEYYKEDIEFVRDLLKIGFNNKELFFEEDKEKGKNYSYIRNAYFTLKQTWDNNIPKVLSSLNNINKYFALFEDPKTERLLARYKEYFKIKKSKYGSRYVLNDDNPIKQFYEKIKELQYSITLDFVYSAQKEILARLRKQGNLTFSDYLLYLRDTLKKDAENGGKLIRHIYNRHRYFLIDEFQDTDPIQAEIFFYLAAKELNVDWKKCIPHKGSLFIVGDPKQSIYRFKNADVASYLNVEKMFVQPVGEVLHLYKNFRSTYVLKDYFNNTFNTMLVESNEQAPFESIPLEDSIVEKGFTGVYKYNIGSDYFNDKNTIKNTILKLINNDDYKISCKDSSCKAYLKKIDYKDFMIITFKKNQTNLLSNYLNQYGIPNYVEGEIDFKKSEVLKCFIDLYVCATNPNDNRYLYNCLKNRLFDIEDIELIELRKDGYYLGLNNGLEEKDISIELKKAIGLINNYSKDSKRLMPSTLFNKIINNIDAYKKIGDKNLEYVYFVLELLKAKENAAEIIDHLDATKYLLSLTKDYNGQERCAGLLQDANQIQIANIHKVKGLEKPIVILALPNSSPSLKSSFRLERSEHGNFGYLFNVVEKLGVFNSNIIETKQYEEKEKEEEESSKCERLRLEYVAATRARNVLIIGEATKKDGSQASKSIWKDLLTQESGNRIDDINNKLESIKAKEKHVEAISPDSIKEEKNILEENRNSLTKESYELFNPSKVIDNDYIEYEDVSERIQKQYNESNGDTFATIAGTMVHRLMEIIVISKDAYPKKQLVDTVINELLNDDFRKEKDTLRNILEKVYDNIHSGGYKQINGTSKDILPIILNADKVYAEVPFTYLDYDNKLWNGIIDLIYEKNDKLHIIDWKTNKSDIGLAEHYKNQLDAYSKAVKKLLDKDVEDAFVYHIDIK